MTALSGYERRGRVCGRKGPELTEVGHFLLEIGQGWSGLVLVLRGGGRKIVDARRGGLQETKSGKVAHGGEVDVLDFGSEARSARRG